MRHFLWLNVLVACSLFASYAGATSHVARFLFVTDSQTVAPGTISSVMTVQAQDSSGAKVAEVGETIDLEFSSSSASGEFLNASGTGAVSTVMAKNTANRNFTYRDSAAGVYTLNIKATGRESKNSWTLTQSITVASDDGSGGGSSVPSSLPTPTLAPGPPASSPAMPSKSSVAAEEKKNIQAFAGDDQAIAVGSLAEFRGSAIGLTGQPLSGARFMWNFGDGETKEGRTVQHIFRVPGSYTVGLHISSGEYAASDYVKVSVGPNRVEAAGVIPGEEGFLRLYNAGDRDTDIGSWTIQDASGAYFHIPSQTKIAPRAEIAFANRITGLFKNGSAASFTAYYPNQSLAFTWSGGTGEDGAAVRGDRLGENGVQGSTKTGNNMPLARTPGGSPVSVGAAASGEWRVPIQDNVSRSDHEKNPPFVMDEGEKKLPAVDQSAATGEEAVLASSGAYSFFAFAAIAVAVGVLAAGGFLFLPKIMSK